MKSRILNYFLAGFAGVALVSCEGENPFGEGSEAEAALSQAYVNAEASANTIYTYVDLSIRDSSLVSPGDSSMVNGAKVKIDANGDYIINFGNGVVGPDNVTRKGKIKCSLGGNFMAQGFSVSASLENYVRDDKPVTGSLTLTINSISLLEVKVGVQYSNFNFNNEFTFSASKDLTWNLGFFTFTDVSDDSYQLSGTATGAEVATGNSVTTTIDPSSALLYDRACQYGMVSGVIDITFSGDSLTYTGGNIDFLASDACNNSVMISLENANTGAAISIPQTFDAF